MLYSLGALAHGADPFTRRSPSSYSITVKTDLKNRTFSGTSEISVDVKTSVSTVVLHVALPLVLRAAAFVVAPGPSTEPGEHHFAQSFSFDQATERVSITFQDQLPVGKAVIILRWDASMNSAMLGYYLTEYPARDGKGPEMYALTQFEPTSARKAFVSPWNRDSG